MISDDAIRVTSPARREDHGLPANCTVFVNFNQNSRIDAGVWGAWMEILSAVPGSVLWLKHSNDLGCEQLREAAAARGVDPQRILFAPDVHEKTEHIARLRLADLGLDTFGRYNGHTSTADALWSGIPVVTMASECFPGRVAASLLTAAGMADCVTTGVEAYKTFAIRLATDPERLRHVRSVLQDARGHAPFFQPVSIVRTLEQAYEAMWQQCQAGQPPSPIEL